LSQCRLHASKIHSMATGASDFPPRICKGRISTLLPAECGRPRPQQARSFLGARKDHRRAEFLALLRPRTGALLYYSCA
jgi:hypothetical protein